MTVRIGIAGIRGRMGREIAALALLAPDIVLVGGVGRADSTEPPVSSDLSNLLPDIAVLVDFTSPQAAAAHAAACAAAGVALICGTTGLDEGEMASLRLAAEAVAVFHAANMSPGVNATLAVLPVLVRALQGYDIEIVETHHRHKVDAPSGTALALAHVAAEASGEPLAGRVRYGREGASVRTPGEIGILAVRSGGNPGEHTVVLAGDGEEIRVTHRAFSRAAYAEGALRAARLIVGEAPGWYDPGSLPGFL